MFEWLAEYSPVLAGTIPIAIDVADSDLDVLCEVYDFDRFAGDLADAYDASPGFAVSAIKTRQSHDSLKVTFRHGGFGIEVFGQTRPVERQTAYRHMIVEARLLALGRPPFRAAILALRHEGLKTEPAFARCLGLAGDAYEAVLALEALSDEKLAALI